MIRNVCIIIREYAFTNSIAKIIKMLEQRGYALNGNPITKEYVKAVIKSKTNDKLHRILKSGYLKRTKHSRGTTLK